MFRIPEVVDTSDMHEIVAEGVEHGDILEQYRSNSTNPEMPDTRRGV